MQVILSSICTRHICKAFHIIWYNSNLRHIWIWIKSLNELFIFSEQLFLNKERCFIWIWAIIILWKKLHIFWRQAKFQMTNRISLPDSNTIALYIVFVSCIVRVCVSIIFLFIGIKLVWHFFYPNFIRKNHVEDKKRYPKY